MHSLFGFFQTSPLGDAAPQYLKLMQDRLRHRGPGSVGRHLDIKSGLAFAQNHRDPKANITPLQIHGLSIVANLAIYEFPRQRAELIAAGTPFQSKSATELPLQLFRKHGLDFPKHLRGEFAIAIYEEAKQQLHLVRDRFGAKPLFYHLRENAIYFASEVKALLAHPDVPVKLDHRAALHQLMQTMLPADSAFEGIQAVKPGHVLTITRRADRLGVHESRYWDFTFPKAEDHDADPDKSHYVATLREKLIEAVAVRTPSHPPAACYLSGGIDSCSILGLVSALRQTPVKAFTISFDSDDYDESHIARAMAEKADADQEVVKFRAADLYGENYIRTAYHAERTFYNTLGVAKWLMSRHVIQSGITTAITGEGSDELFGGYPSFKRDMFLHGLKKESAEMVATFREAMDRSNKLFQGAILAENQLSHPALDELCGFTPSWIQPWMHTLQLARPLLAPELREELADYDPIAAIAASLDPGQITGRHPLDIAQYTWSKTMLEGQILNWGGDRVDMAHAMESRPPFLDPQLVEFATTLPPSLRIRGNTEKWVLREAMRSILPEILYKREKFAFMAPPGHSDKSPNHPLKKLITRYLNRNAVAEAGLLDPRAVSRFLAEYESDTNATSLVRKDALLNHLLGLQILHDQFVVGNVPANL